VDRSVVLGLFSSSLLSYYSDLISDVVPIFSHKNSNHDEDALYKYYKSPRIVQCY